MPGQIQSYQLFLFHISCRFSELYIVECYHYFSHRSSGPSYMESTLDEATQAADMISMKYIENAKETTSGIEQELFCQP